MNNGHGKTLALYWPSASAKDRGHRGAYVPFFAVLESTRKDSNEIYLAALRAAYELGFRGHEMKKEAKWAKRELPLFKAPFPYFQIDIDLPINKKGAAQSQAIKKRLIEMDAFAFVAISPSLCGVKAFIALSDSNQYSAMIERLKTALGELSEGVKFDSTASSDCFSTCDKDAYINEAAAVFTYPSPPVLERKEHVSINNETERAVRKAFNIASKEAGALDTHAGRTLYAKKCFFLGVSASDAYHLAPVPLGIDEREFERRYNCMYRNQYTAGRFGSEAV